MKEPLNMVVSIGAGGIEVQAVGLSVGEVHGAFDKLCAAPRPEWTELLIFDRMKPRKRRTFRDAPVGSPVYVATPPKKFASRIIRRGR